MSFFKLLTVFSAFSIIGCSSSPAYNDATNCGSLTPLCLAIVATTEVITSDSSSKKCSEMTGDNKAQCKSQVRALKHHINEANSR